MNNFLLYKNKVLTFSKLIGLSSIGTTVQLLTSLITGKIIAVFFGSAGLVMVGQLSNMITIGTNLTSLGSRFGFVKIASRDSSKIFRKEMYSVLSFYLLLVGYFFSIIFIIFSKFLSSYYLLDEKYMSIVFLLALTLPLVNLFTLLNSVLNGFQNFTKQVKINIVASILKFSPLLLVFFIETDTYLLLLLIIIGNVFVGSYALIYGIV